MSCFIYKHVHCNLRSLAPVVANLVLVTPMQRVFFSAIAVICASCAGTPFHVRGSDADKPLGQLVFRGTAISTTGPTTDYWRPWVITMRVDKVLSGSFKGKQFQFPVHSPAQSHLNVGKQYTIRATRTKTGYSVDELQWLYAAAKKAR
jgi:hypothetical protein